MKRSTLLTLASLLFFVWSAVAFAADSRSEEITILPLGDSITQGGGSFTCYRQILVPELEKRQANVRFVGPNQDKTSAHAGYGGKNAKYLRSIVRDVYTQFPADVVLLHAGHNCFSEDKPVAGLVEDTEAIIATIRSLNPQVTILLAQVIPAGKLPKYDYLPELNQQLAVLAKRLASETSPLILVNQAEGFDWKTDTVADHVHPNAAGAQKMADKWLAALLPLL